MILIMVYDLSTGGLMKKKKNEVREFEEDVEEFMYQCFLINIKI